MFGDGSKITKKTNVRQPVDNQISFFFNSGDRSVGNLLHLPEK